MLMADGLLHKELNYMSGITIYEKTTCSKCRMTKELLDDAGVEYSTVTYYDEPLTHDKLAELIQKLGITPRELLRTGEDIYKELNLEERDLTDDELIDIMIQHPDLIERPIVEKGDTAIIARPPEKAKELL